ncbi:hypothetical protein PVAND_006951 [Polypedilum vanderplanki]|uniref:Uncharacterized protein n=1 Tax=Polypedilum vanderplanki TaxID=319348 RepID=A0A9J6C574_POLVA|nr:hypothetical protein PVAND_006951 [Polypedilum vanderplanki]
MCLWNFEEGYRDKLLSEEMQSMVPAGLQGKADVLFGNLHEIYTFHSDVFLKDLENSICMTELVALCFVQRRDVFFRLYSYYCQNIPRSEKLRETLVDTHLFLSECQKKLGHKLPLAAYLLKPVQRITKYQLLLKDLLKFSDTGTCTKELQKALDCMLVVLKCVNDSMHQIAITGFPADLSQQGDLLLQDSFQICSENKKDLRLRIKPQQRHVFLYQKAILFCKQDTKTGHNKSTYQFKHWLKMSQIGLTNTVRGDPKKFELWLEGRSEVHTFQAPTTEIKQKWVAEIGRVLMYQLTILKDEQDKKRNVNNRPLKPSKSVTCDAPLPTVNERAKSIDSSADNLTKRITSPITVDDTNNTPSRNSTVISASSSEHDNHENNAWSSDYSNSEDEYPMLEENVPNEKKQMKRIRRRAGTKHCDEKFDRNSAEILVEACNLKVQEKINQYQAMMEEHERLNEATNSSLVPCSIVVNNADESKSDTNNDNDKCDRSDGNQKRQSIISDSSADGSRSDLNAEDAKTSEQASSSVFYVIWD